MAEKNVYQVADWNGQSGERWVAYQARLDAMMAVFGQAAIEAAAPAMGERVLDVGCGAGASSLDLAARIAQFEIDLVADRKLFSVHDFQTGLGYFDNINHARFKFPTWSLPPCAAMNMATADRQ